MLRDHEKTRHYAKVIVEWAPIGYKRKFNYGVLVTKTKKFTAEQIQAVADGSEKNQSIIQGKSSDFLVDCSGQVCLADLVFTVYL